MVTPNKTIPTKDIVLQVRNYSFSSFLLSWQRIGNIKKKKKKKDEQSILKRIKESHQSHLLGRRRSSSSETSRSLKIWSKNSVSIILMSTNSLKVNNINPFELRSVSKGLERAFE